jgi:predicted ester cyclase
VSEAARELVRRQFEDVFNNQDFSLCEAIFAPGAVEGPAHAREVVEWLRSQFPDLRMTVEAIVAEGDMVAALVRSEGTNTGSSTV